MTSKHWEEERKNREELIRAIGIGKVVDSFIVDKGHKNGPERHEITTTGIIVIYNARTNKLITKLIARVGQIRRYYKDGNAPKEIIKEARKHMEMGYNYR